MSVPITPADRAAAEKALRDLWFECGQKPRNPHGGVDVVAQAIADARVDENQSCELAALARARSLPSGEKLQVILAANDIAARRSR